MEYEVELRPTKRMQWWIAWRPREWGNGDITVILPDAVHRLIHFGPLRIQWWRKRHAERCTNT